MKICPYSFAQVLTLQITYDNKNMVCIYMGFESDSNLFLMILRIKTTPLPLLNLVTNCKDFASLARPSTSRVMLLGQKQATTYMKQTAGKDSCGRRCQAGITQELCTRAKAAPIPCAPATSTARDGSTTQ